jgi:hypothetical protein
MKAKKQVRNKFRDRLADYYLTNREITKQSDARYEEEKKSGEKRSWSGSEKIMAAVTFIALILLAVKYLVF